MTGGCTSPPSRPPGSGDKGDIKIRVPQENEATFSRPRDLAYLPNTVHRNKQAK